MPKKEGVLKFEEEDKNDSGEIDRQPTKWVNFVSDKKYVKEETPYRTYINVPCVFEGEVEYVGEGEAKFGKVVLPSGILVLRCNGTKYGFNFPKGSYYYAYITDGRKIEKGDKVRVRYLGLAKDLKLKGLPLNPNCHIIKIEILQKVSNDSG